MKIKKITLFNIGPYVGKNTFDFSIDKQKNIVLIGGKNGAGKTTFFNSIKTCLYGCKVWGYDAPGKEYYSIISSLVNSKTVYDSNSTAFVEIELVFDDGKNVDSYILHREWKKFRMSFSEYFNIKKNGELIIGTDEDDFVNYLLSIVPPDMFNFYFFDGESIAEFFLGADGNKNFRNAFLKLYGLDTLTILVENFARNIKKSDAKNTTHDAYKQAQLMLENAENDYNELINSLSNLENKIDLYAIKLHSLASDYSKEGGISLTQWKQLNADISKEESNRDSLNKWLKETANHYIPFILIEKNLNKLLSELTKSQENQKTEVVIEAISNNDFATSLNQLFKEKKTNDVSVDEIINIIKQNLIVEESIDFDYSSNQMNKLISQIYEKLDFDKKEIERVLKQLKSSLRKSKKLRDTLVNSSIDGYEQYLNEKEDLEKSISDSKIEIEQIKHNIEQQQVIVADAKTQFDKAKSNYENMLKNKSINDLSERAVATYSLLEEQLVRRQANILQEAFIKCFKSIINKNNFIDGIIIDKNINVIPYKYVSVRKDQLSNYIQVNNNFLELYGKAKLSVELNRLEMDIVDSVELPSPIKVPFSKGERQVYIMSIYLALLKTSRKDIPFFIDTPFARIDSNHREKIIKEFFLNIRNQLFVLSTDEEIVGAYKEKMDERISDIFTLKISNYGRTKIVPNEYFGE